jgi:hypothetical protein
VLFLAIRARAPTQGGTIRVKRVVRNLPLNPLQ